MTYKNDQKKRGERLIREGFFDADKGGATFMGKPRSFVLQNGINNLFPHIRKDILAYFELNDIQWWGGNHPTGHVLSSQIACLNHLFSIRQNKIAVLSLLNSISFDFVDVLPVAEHLEGYIQFEAVGGATNLLGEGVNTRGSNCTSVDALIYAQHRDGRRFLVPIEWKYVETYGNDDKSMGSKGDTRKSRYVDLITKSNYLNENALTCCWYEPFYQLMRQTLWAEQLLHNKASGLEADDYLHIHVVPDENTELLNKIYPCSDKGMEETWKSCLQDPEKYVLVSPTKLWSKQKSNTKIYQYLMHRYWPIDSSEEQTTKTTTNVTNVETVDDTTELHTESQTLLPIMDSFSIDVLNENLYSYDSTVFSLSPAVQNKASEGLISKINQLLNSIPAAQKAQEYVLAKIEYTPRLDLISDEIKQALQNGTAEIIPCKNSADAFYLQIRTTIKDLVINGQEYEKNRKIKDIPLGAKAVPSDIFGAMQCLSMQNQLNQIASGLKEISEACEFNFSRLIQGQRDNRLAKLLNSRSCFIQALAMSDELSKRQMLLQAVHDANSARAELAYQIKADLLLLGGEKPPKSKDMGEMVNDINTAMIAMNNAVQISLYSYQVLGERNAQLAVVKEHETFIKQVLQKKIVGKGNKTAWTVICSSGNTKSNPKNILELPAKLLRSYDSFIEGTGNDTKKLLEEKFDG